ncbi:MAG: hypothetical protein U9P50_00725 [Patescibacteria group bacterium]|nr:hypothetical protein [Patescibacteria group bacterium]
MSKKTFSIFLVVFIYIIFILNILASHFFLYWKFWWFDIIMHFLGGFWVALLSYYIFFLSKYFRRIKEKLSIFYTSLFFVITVGILWEIFEYLAKASIYQSNFNLDTSLDILMDMLGWLLAYFILLKLRKDKSFVAEKGKLDKMDVTVESS